MAWFCRYVECMPDVGRVQLLPEDSMVLMASDGLWDVLSDQQAVDTAEVGLLDPASCRQNLSAPTGNPKALPRLERMDLMEST